METVPLRMVVQLIKQCLMLMDTLGESAIEVLRFVKMPFYSILVHLTLHSEGLCLKSSKIQGNSTWLTWKL